MLYDGLFPGEKLNGKAGGRGDGGGRGRAEPPKSAWVVLFVHSGGGGGSGGSGGGGGGVGGRAQSSTAKHMRDDFVGTFHNRLDGIARLGVVDCSKNAALCKRRLGGRDGEVGTVVCALPFLTRARRLFM